MQRVLNAIASALAVIGEEYSGPEGLFRVNLLRRYLGAHPQARRIAYVAGAVVGLWAVMALVVPRVLIAFGVRGLAPGTRKISRSLVGSKMPRLIGRTLSGQRVTIPEDTKSKIAALVMGTDYDARFDVEDWSRAVKERFGRERDVVVIEMPVIGGAYPFFAPMIEAGMRRGTPAEMHDYVVTVYGQQGRLKEALRAAPGRNTWVFLLDKNGTVRFQHGGSFDEKKFEELASRVEPLLTKRTARATKKAA